MRTLDQLSDGAVTFLDVLGWKGIWNKEDFAVDNLLKLIEELRDRASIYSATIGEEYGDRGITTQVLSISDTIAIFTPGDPLPTLRIHAQLCSYAIPQSIKKKIPLRGATSYGKFMTASNIMVGPAVDESASWHEQTDWIGVILTPSAILKVGQEKPVEWDNYLKIPFKGKVSGMNFCVKWDLDIDPSDHFYEIGSPHVPQIANKFLNTMSYIEHRRTMGGR